VKQPTPAQLEARRKRAEDAAALDAMCAARPLKPPPYNFEQRRVSASELALRADVRAGLW
jgi:hypothetical protein